MKKILIFLVGILFLQSGYCDYVAESAKKIDDIVLETIGESALREMCVQFLRYTEINNLAVVVFYKEPDGRSLVFFPHSSGCGKYTLEQLKDAVLTAANRISEDNVPEVHSECVQRAMIREADSCLFRTYPYSLQYVKPIEDKYGIKFIDRPKSDQQRTMQMLDYSGPDSSVKIDCSKTDDRCVVSRALDDGRYFVSCCVVPIEYCSENYVDMGTVEGLSITFSERAMSLADVDSVCKFIQ